MEGVLQRHGKRFAVARAGVHLQQAILAPLFAVLGLQFDQHGSTDPIFDWNGNFFAVGIEWNLFLGGQQ